MTASVSDRAREEAGFVPSHLVLTAPGVEPSRTTLVVHGILGSAANWRGYVRGLLDGRWGDGERARATRWVLVDLRGHGDNFQLVGGAPPPHTVAACAADIRRLEARLGVEFDRVVGHSFGGRVALELGRAPGGVREIVSIDSPPGPAFEGPAARVELERVLAALGALSPGGAPLPGRAEVASALRAAGMSEALALWMTTNVRGTAETGYRWKFDLAVVEALLDDYFATDLVPVVKELSRSGSVGVRFVVGGRSDRFDARTRAALAELGRVDVLPDAGHWVHVDDPAGLAGFVTG
ncbi:MAG: alpha/beta hydrolase [Deltaproteobacteria bacterium]|nr:alpha/beta hydrolase [Deltaproteobacteria bacterium]